MNKAQSDFEVSIDQLLEQKAALVSKRTQIVAFLKSGEVLSSCNTLCPIDTSKTIYEQIPFMNQIADELQSDLSLDAEMLYPATNTSINEFNGLLGFMISRVNSTPDIFFCTILNYTPSGRKGVQNKRPEDCRVLVVDDQTINQIVLCQILKQKGYPSNRVESGEHALELLNEQDFEVVLLDLNMPGMDGQSTLAKIRNELDNDNKRHIVIAVSSQKALDKLDQDDVYGFDAVIPKPPQANQLLTTLARLINPPASLQAPQKLINLAYLKEVAGDNNALIRDLIDIFLQTVPDAIAEMQRLNSVGDMATLKEVAHKIKANFKYVGVNKLFELSDQIERESVSSQQEGEISSMISRIADIVQPVLKELQTYRTRLD